MEVREEFNDYKADNKGNLYDIPSENSSVQTSNKVIIIIIF